MNSAAGPYYVCRSREDGRVVDILDASVHSPTADVRRAFDVVLLALTTDELAALRENEAE